MRGANIVYAFLAVPVLSDGAFFIHAGTALGNGIFWTTIKPSQSVLRQVYI
jgi:hypothetical protein